MDSVKIKLSFLFLTLLCCTQIFGQDFIGFVKKGDSTSAPIYQATVEILQNNKSVSSLKTYFDGSFKFTPAKNQAYTIKISYSGYSDTTYSISADKKAIPTPATVTVKLKKDGMRLMGEVKSADESFPIKDVTIILKNVMTRQEDRQTTSVNGQYNFKLDYETNYRLSIDKRSSGVFNKYRDTTFYVSTIGFNQPLDYKLDINLTKDLTQHNEMPSGYNASKVTASKDLKPVVPISEGKPITSIAVGKRVYTTAKALDPKLVPDTGSKTQGATQNNPPVAIATKKSLEDSLAQLRTEQLRIARQEIAKKEHDDSITKLLVATRKKEVRDSLTKVAQANKFKALQDSVYQANAAQYKLIADKAAKEARRDSLAKAKTEQLPVERVVAAQKAASDSGAHLAVATIDYQKVTQDSIKAIRLEQKRIAQQVVAQKAYQDSVNKTLVYAHQKLVQDSINHAKREMQAATDARLIQKAYDDSVSRVLAALHKKAVYDSIAKTAQVNKLKSRQDSIYQAIANKAAKEAKRDSLEKAKAEQLPVDRVIAAKKAAAD